MDFRRQIGRNLVRHRTGLGLSQQDLAWKADVTIGQISRIENGRADPQAGTLLRLAGGLGVPVAELFEGTQ